MMLKQSWKLNSTTLSRIQFKTLIGFCEVKERACLLVKCENIRHKCNLIPYQEELLQIRDGELGLPPGTGHHGEGRDAGGR